MQTNPADKLCLQKNPPKTGPKCRQILQTNLVKTENCRQLQKKCRQSLSSIVRKGLSILGKLCLYPKILELALRVLRLLFDTCCHHAEVRVHRVAASPSGRAGSQGRDLESPRSRPNWHLNTPQTRRRCLHTSTIKAHLPPCSPDAPEDPTRVQPPEGERI